MVIDAMYVSGILTRICENNQPHSLVVLLSPVVKSLIVLLLFNSK